MEKFCHVYYYNSKYFRADINVSTICGVTNTVMDVTTTKNRKERSSNVYHTKKLVAEKWYGLLHSQLVLYIFHL